MSFKCIHDFEKLHKRSAPGKNVRYEKKVCKKWKIYDDIKHLKFQQREINKKTSCVYFLLGLQNAWHTYTHIRNN